MRDQGFEMIDPVGTARDAMRATGQWLPGQVMGRRWPIGCVALEVTQRCNLDCTLCYLSESSEALEDPPLWELFRRLDAIRARYGPGTDVQITGGDPTLRRRDELVAIVKYASRAGLRSTLFTNGIRATRALLGELAAAGMEAVAFHVDTTQQRKGHADEADLNSLRDEYLARARGLPLAVYFNTTVHDGNFEALPELARFFVSRAGRVSFASFQLQADTGRGVLGSRSLRIAPDSVAAQIRAGAGAALDFDVLQAGHARCNRYGLALVVNGRVHDLFDDPAFVQWALAETAHLSFARTRPVVTIGQLAGWALTRPRVWHWLARKAWSMKRDLLAARGRVHKLAFFIHNFMDARSLDQERLAACVFMAAGRDGPVPMCAYNARRDQYLGVQIPIRLTRKNARGRARLRV